jgi:hypothetical protein
MEQILIDLIGSLDLFLIVIAMVTFTAVKNILKKILGLPTGKNPLCTDEDHLKISRVDIYDPYDDYYSTLLYEDSHR